MTRAKLVVFFLTITAIAHGQVDLKKLDAYYANALKNWEVPGMAVGIVKDGKLVFAKGYGVKELGKPEAPDENSLFAIASITKAFTTATIAMLEKEGKLSLNDKVRKHLPYFELYNPFVSQDATIRDILCHRIGHRTFGGDAIWYLSDNLSAEQIIRRAKHLESEYPFRSGYGYSNIMYITAGEVIKAASGDAWAEAVQKKILNPLGMNRTVTSSKDLNQKGNFTTPHGLTKNQHAPIPWEDWGAIAATGGIISSVKDMSQWMIFNLNHGVWGKDTLLTPRLRNELWTPHNPFVVNNTDADFDTHFRGYGLGWGLSDYKGKLRVSHTGGYSGMLSNLVLIPDEKLGVIVLTNGMKGGLMTAVANYTVDAYLKSTQKDWSADFLANYNKAQAADTRIPDRIKAHVSGTHPSVALDQYAGKYLADIYGTIEIKREGDKLRMYFEHSSRFNATLEHWHYDVWRINWDNAKDLSWFEFGTVQFKLDNNLIVTELAFDVPNDDIWFDELKPKRK